jgi:hypothetical protein
MRWIGQNKIMLIKAVDSAIQKIMRTAQRKDVVPVDSTKWTQPPVFKATATRIFTRLFNRSVGAERFPGIGGAGLLIGGIALMAAAILHFGVVRREEDYLE